MAFIQKIPQSEVINLKNIVTVEPEQMLSQTLVNREELGMTLFSLDKNQAIGRHSSPGDAMVNILSGIAKITIDESDYIVKAGETIVMPANRPHALYALEAFQMLLIVVKPEVS
ncbi:MULTISPECIES: cupin domain-containing protein [unclassified Enterococcus]|uniref:cupin domain-containing protein n=1 Tax=unclassified Enterococcus TaxID=2608891 RepID=UPI0015570EAB|nr:MULTISPECIES: cupin domain-containing protein [unclassified Enterococcus]MBS7576047.1 cupin domain-containing protein [Enterococcus sp. MMGLQ5-2]MBS7583280.1 cupin domain-containing protein [Enterococcus sp. MMGLQ5-1]NPD11140.1 cupin domain-containing protein [Enterococcus sp. MMGLQ5-1]NPD35883.1 cupin domain-containing protein [Enterococcus sp. MMGLQ5-2]